MDHEEEMSLIPFKSFVKVTKTKHIIEVQHMEKMNTRANILKLDKHTYIQLDTGEIKEFNHKENRQQNLNSLRKTFKQLRYLINNNFEGKANELHVTLTYRENMTDTKKLYQDFDKFMKKLKYRYRNETTIDYINVLEPQERGAWHCHLLIRFNDLDKIYIPNKFDEENNPINAPLYEMWGNGWVTIKTLKDVDNIGAYLSAYLADIELTEENKAIAYRDEAEVVTKQIEGKDKKIIKGGRLHMYPVGMKLYRRSKGIVKPERKNMRYEDIKKIVGSAKPHYSKTFDIKIDEFENSITFEQYNLKRTANTFND